MKIAITADIHLRNGKNYTSRFNALVDVLRKLQEEDIKVLIIAGDCFDYENSDFNLLEVAIDQSQILDLQVYLLPGNHDPFINQSMFSKSKIFVIEDTQLIEIGGINFLFVPYKDNNSMGSEVGKWSENIKDLKWVLVGHGDLLSNINVKSEYEKGIYMPLSIKDIELFQPNMVFLGHIHAQTSLNNIYYSGSPCGLDITETGHRRFLVFDTFNFKVESHNITTDYIYINERILIYPTDKEEEYLKNKLDHIFFNFANSQEMKKIVRITLAGYSFDRNITETYVKGYLEKDPNILFYELKILDLLPANSDQVRLSISERVLENASNINFGNYSEIKELITQEIMNLIFGRF
ncbi:MAG: metallophosphoesterase [Anaerolineaceae bacterium]|nr:metallophosphoesterase [Anaerolineaceae bacterium]